MVMLDNFKQTTINLGFDLENGFKKVGFALDILSASQTAFTCIENTNRWLSTNFGVNFSIFYEQNALPCLSLQFARFHIRDAIGFEGDLIATSFATLKSIKSATRSRRYYYIQDLEWTRSWFSANKDEALESLKDDKIIKICRSKYHAKHLEEIGINVSPIIVEDFNIDQILEIINENKVSR